MRLFAHATRMMRGRKRKRDIFATTAGRCRGRRAALHATRTHARTQRARTNSRRTPHRPNPPLPDEPRVFTRPVRAPSEPGHLVVCQVSRRHARMRMYFFRAPPGAGRASARADARSRSARGRVRVRAHLPTLPAGRGDGIAANPRPAERRQRASDRTCAFSRGSFPRALNDPSEALTAS